MTIVICGDGAPAHRKLAGYLRAVVSVPAADAAAGSIRLLAPFSLTACGAVPIAPLPDDPHARVTPRDSSNRRASGGGGGSSVVRQLAAHRCVEVEGRVLGVVVMKEEDGGVAEARAVVLVDVHLPVAAWSWSGCQFPRARASAAAAVFKHLSCNWDARKALVAFDWSSHDNAHCDDQYIWSCTDPFI